MKKRLRILSFIYSILIVSPLYVIFCISHLAWYFFNGFAYPMWSRIEIDIDVGSKRKEAWLKVVTLSKFSWKLFVEMIAQLKTICISSDSNTNKEKKIKMSELTSAQNKEQDTLEPKISTLRVYCMKWIGRKDTIYNGIIPGYGYAVVIANNAFEAKTLTESESGKHPNGAPIWGWEMNREFPALRTYEIAPRVLVCDFTPHSNA